MSSGHQRMCGITDIFVGKFPKLSKMMAAYLGVKSQQDSVADVHTEITK
jgi:hypothetical protein